MRCSITRADRTPITKPLPTIGRTATGNELRKVEGRNDMVIPMRDGSPITRIFSKVISFFERKTIFFPAAT